MCLVGCGRTGISLSELKPSLEMRSRLQAVNLPNELTNVVIVEEEASVESTDDETLAYYGVDSDNRQGTIDFRTGRDRLEVQERQDSERQHSSRSSSFPSENQESSMNNRSQEFSEDGDGFRRVRLITTGEDAVSPGGGGLQEKSSVSQESFGSHSILNWSQNLQGCESVNQRDERLQPDRTNLEIEPRVQKSSFPASKDFG